MVYPGWTGCDRGGPPMRFGHVELRVADPRQARKFYEDVLGFEVVAEQAEVFIWLKLGEVELLLRPGENVARSPSFDASPSNIVLYTEDLPGAQKRLEERGVRFAGEDQGCPVFADPDGNWFQLVDPEGE
ncbi:MAG: hypothetical protein GF346_13110 [Candidatus Eisenbacteria bacterium]|nr:hypothetical protein [Candidatus Latescibacterota bacterium]MBD3303378.1 hypothetical protein [Candidatus Eisenbacteria bacterium]